MDNLCIDPKMIPDLYRKHKLKAVRYVIYDSVIECGCVLGVLLLENNLHRENISVAIGQLETVGYKRSYLFGLFGGFDGDPICVLDDPIGYQHGQEAWSELKKAGLVYA